MITVTAVNSVTESNPSNTAFTTTAEAGEITIHVLLIQNYHLNVSSTAPGLVQSLSASSVNVTNITIQWDRVDCQERNGDVESYRIVYYPTLDPGDRSARTVAGTGDSDRIFTFTGLPPRTSYTFEVQASNPGLDVRGARATFTISTSAPQSETTHMGGSSGGGGEGGVTGVATPPNYFKCNNASPAPRLRYSASVSPALPIAR